jgi:phosphopantetheinyl transferase (holo-ACP synthase)
MIGNDVVDLELAAKESNWERKGFLNKIFTPHEQLLVLSAPNASLMVWNLWSRKEAAYKIFNRQTGIRTYAPLQLSCFEVDETAAVSFGKIYGYQSVCFTQTTITASSVHTIAVLQMDDFKNVKHLESAIHISKTNGVPNYYDHQTQSLRAVSISHHGRFEQRVCLF